MTNIRFRNPIKIRPASRAVLAAFWSICLAGLIATSFTAHAKTMQAPGSRISLDLPENFKPSPSFAGFMEILSSAAIIILEMPTEAYDQVTAGFTPEALGKKSITNVKAAQLKRDDTHFYITGEQSHPRAVFEKHILVLKDAKNTAVLTFNIPKDSFADGSIKREDVIKALTSARLEPKAAPSRDLFTLSYLGPFEQTGAPTGTSRIYTEAADKSPKAIRNIMVIAPSLNQLPIGNITEFSNYAIENLQGAEGLSVQAEKPIEIDSMAGHLITANATRGEANTPVVIRQLILVPAPGGYYRLLTITKAADEARMAPEIDKIFASFKATQETLRAE